jgi:hypothetical protein
LFHPFVSRSPSSRSSRSWWSEWSAYVRSSARRCVRPSTSSPRSLTAPSAVDRAPTVHAGVVALADKCAAGIPRQVL